MAILKRKTSSVAENLPIDMLHLSNPQSVLDYAINTLKVRPIPFDLDDFISKIGIDLQRTAMADELSGMLQKNAEGRWTITVNSLHHPKRQRFTLAHELGHYFLHRNRAKSFVDEALYRSTHMDSMEYEANNFAGALLMPKNQLITFMNSNGPNAELISEYFDVSVLAAKIRVETLQRNIYEY
ncbi:ImmA/IrrE family metallo-endopeptidase [Salmonella enterica subsp. enterica serovar Agama]|nr:ImmA/IrrE family metallo-endopeptidase [Salmonella enterica subsp. enterica]EAA9213786.1 ImmA/IrrE family metallo-endopeptidase [Salmonella enterica subsp. enterica serovar Agama]EAZ9711102.1 ImmA/IrrE family metallo-endopeptidase [Salmonella enterica subsp. enterica serovar Typhimurium]EBH9100872.1 ImmA/IrrE family metallo-endopeptidase [Salmonella enterica subsp. enterica serovar Colindale]EIY6649390.1 ImmA/IrrE family metallo-endopeptidase [Salmonella enterica]